MVNNADPAPLSVTLIDGENNLLPLYVKVDSPFKVFAVPVAVTT